MTQKFKWWQNSKTQIMTKLKNSKTQIVTKLEMWKISTYEERNQNRAFWLEHFDTLTTDEMFSGQRFVILAMFFYTNTVCTFVRLYGNMVAFPRLNMDIEFIPEDCTWQGSPTCNNNKQTTLTLNKYCLWCQNNVFLFI